MGGPGWEYTMTKTDGKSLSLRAFFNYWIQERDGDDFSDMLHRSSMLFKMYNTVGFVRKDQQHFIYDEEGALSMGLLENDEEYVVCIRQATLDCMDEKLHELFANILVHCLLANSRALFDQFKADFMELRRCNKALPEPLSDDMMLGKAMFYTLKGFDNCFQHHRLSLWDYPTFEVFRDLGERQLLNDPRSRL
ncbi:hypothetical protein DYB26_014843 [Aphanomyces astaci]|uniref:Uncharacterized protein n=1 Tax=Aphanomyces astaci TaxID=112090 RepID=A0A418EEA8_APHAT|nr:hypothetical protein DYB26_014843 [Aphanomyces astaci]